MKHFKADAAEYNYVDEGRIIYKKCFLWNDLIEDIKNVDKGVLDKCQNRDEFVLVNKSLYDNTARRYKLKIKKEKEDMEMKGYRKSIWAIYTTLLVFFAMPLPTRHNPTMLSFV